MKRPAYTDVFVRPCGTDADGVELVAVRLACLHRVSRTLQVPPADVAETLAQLLERHAADPCASRMVRACDRCWGRRYTEHLVPDGPARVRCARGCDARPLHERRFVDPFGRLIAGADAGGAME